MEQTVDACCEPSRGRSSSPPDDNSIAQAAQEVKSFGTKILYKLNQLLAYIFVHNAQIREIGA